MQLTGEMGRSFQAVSNWEWGVSLPNVMLLPAIARLYGVWVDDLYKPSVKGYEDNAQRLMAVYEHSHKPVDYLAAAEEFEKLFRTEIVTPDDWRTYCVLHEYMVYHCIIKSHRQLPNGHGHGSLH